LREKAESIKSEELQKALLKLSSLGESDLKLIEGMKNSIVNKLVHFPTSVLKSDIEDKEIIIEIVNRMFDLNLLPDNDKNNQSSQGESSGESEEE
jgi:glutamyl-tRNA reductase